MIEPGGRSELDTVFAKERILVLTGLYSVSHQQSQRIFFLAFALISLVYR